MFFDSLTEAIRSLVISVRGQSVETALLKREIRLLHKTLRLRMPGQVKLQVVKQESGSMATKFKLVLPAATDKDVLEGGKRTLKVTVGEQPEVMQVLVGAAVESEELTGEEHDMVVGSLMDTDDDGLESPAREFSFEIPDVTPPAQPGEVSIEIISQD